MIYGLFSVIPVKKALFRNSPSFPEHPCFHRNPCLSDVL
jgi:hypothetical protein